MQNIINKTKIIISEELSYSEAEEFIKNIQITQNQILEEMNYTVSLIDYMENGIPYKQIYTRYDNEFNPHKNCYYITIFEKAYNENPKENTFIIMYTKNKRGDLI